MDPHAAWLRRVVLVHLGRTVGAQVVLLALLALGVARSLGLTWSVSVPWAVLFGQMVVFALVGSRLISGPLSSGYLRGYTERPLAFTADPLVSGSDGDLEEVLADHGLQPLASLSTSCVDAASDAGADQQATYEVFGTGDRITFLSRAAGGGATLVISALQDGRYLVTTDYVLVPNRLLVVNLQPGRGPARLVTAHMKVLGALAGQGLHSSPSSPAVVAAVLRCEQESFAALGPLLGSFVRLDGPTAPWRLSAGVNPADLRRLAGKTPGPQRLRPQRSSGQAVSRQPVGLQPIDGHTGTGAIGAPQPVASAHHA